MHGEVQDEYIYLIRVEAYFWRFGHCVMTGGGNPDRIIAW